MSNVHLDGTKQNKAHVFLWRGRNLIAKFWFYGDGSVRYREWEDRSPEHIEITKGETLIFKPQTSEGSAQ